MSALAVATGVDQPRSGLPRHRRPARGARCRRRRHPRRAQPVPAGRRASPSCARAIADAPTPVVRDRARRRHRGARHRRRDRSDRGRAAGAVRARRRGRHLRAVLRLVRRVHRAWRARSGGSCNCARPTTRSIPTSSRAPITPRTRLLLLNSPHNPTGKVFSRAELEAVAATAAWSTISSRSPTRSTSTWCSTASTSRSRRCPACASARVTISSGGKTFSFTGWKIGWVCAPAGARRRGTHGQAVPHLRERRAVPARDRGRPRGCPTRYFARLAADLRDKRDRLCAGLADAGLAVLPSARHVLRHRRHPAARRARRPRVLPRRCPSGAAWSRCRTSCSTTTATAGLPLVRFAFCKRLEVIDEAVARLKGLAPMKVAAVQHDIVWEDPRRQLRAPRADDRGRRRRPAPDSSCSPRCSRPGSRWTTERIAEPFDGPSAQFLVEQAARARRVGVRLGARAARRRTSRPVERARARRTRRHGAPLRARSTRSRTRGEHEHYARRATSTSPSTSRASGSASSSATTCASPTSSGPSRRDTDCYVVVANWPEPRRDHWRTLLVARVRSRTRPTSWASTASGEGGRLAYCGRQRCSSIAMGRDPRRRRRRRGAGAARRRRSRGVAATRERYPFLDDRRSG